MATVARWEAISPCNHAQYASASPATSIPGAPSARLMTMRPARPRSNGNGLSGRHAGLRNHSTMASCRGTAGNPAAWRATKWRNCGRIERSRRRRRSAGAWDTSRYSLSGNSRLRCDEMITLEARRAATSGNSTSSSVASSAKTDV